MRIIGGKYKSRRINLPKENKKEPKFPLRPTSDRARETLFDVLSNLIDFDGVKCLDLFAGTGALGFEALSRGAGFCDFVDISKDTYVSISKTIDELDCSENSAVTVNDTLRFLKGGVNVYYDIVFADPPYSYEKYEMLDQEVMKLKPQLFVLETSREFKSGLKREGYDIIEKKAGAAKFTIFIQK